MRRSCIYFSFLPFPSPLHALWVLSSNGSVFFWLHVGQVSNEKGGLSDVQPGHFPGPTLIDMGSLEEQNKGVARWGGPGHSRTPAEYQVDGLTCGWRGESMSMPEWCLMLGYKGLEVDGDQEKKRGGGGEWVEGWLQRSTPTVAAHKRRPSTP